jgi:hypothetical protein
MSHLAALRLCPLSPGLSPPGWCTPVLTSSLVGILGEDDNGDDLGMLEKKLVEKYQQSRQASQTVSQPTSPSQATSGQDRASSTPRSSITSPEPTKDKDHDHDKRRSVPPAPPAPSEGTKQDEEEVEALSEMMCSLVTNNSGETRYIGISPVGSHLLLVHCLMRTDSPARRLLLWVLDLLT